MTHSELKEKVLSSKNIRREYKKLWLEFKLRHIILTLKTYQKNIYYLFKL